jgi:hypothetical protein
MEVKLICTTPNETIASQLLWWDFGYTKVDKNGIKS